MAGTSDVPESAIRGPQVIEYISINHNEVPQQRSSDGVTITGVSPRDQQRLIPAGSSALLSSAAPTDHGGE
eukprot:2490964-Amphidinium_carterae.1